MEERCIIILQDHRKKHTYNSRIILTRLTDVVFSIVDFSLKTWLICNEFNTQCHYSPHNGSRYVVIHHQVSSIVAMKDETKHHLRFKSKEIFTRLIRKFGFVSLYAMPYLSPMLYVL